MRLSPCDTGKIVQAKFGYCVRVIMDIIEEKAEG